MTDRLNKREIWGIMILLALHAVIIPLLISVVQIISWKSDASISDAVLNLIYYLIDLAVAMLVARKFLRRSWGNLLDRPYDAVKCFLIAWGIYLGLNMVMNLVLMMFPFFENANPNQSAITDVAEQNTGIIILMTVFLAPIVEEVIFRGGIFCGLYHKSRILAYAVTILAFSVYHVWQFVAVFGDWRYLLFALQYVPATVALCWCYEKSGSIWTAIFFHMSVNTLSVLLM